MYSILLLAGLYLKDSFDFSIFPATGAFVDKWLDPFHKNLDFDRDDNLWPNSVYCISLRVRFCLLIVVHVSHIQYKKRKTFCMNP